MMAVIIRKSSCPKKMVNLCNEIAIFKHWGFQTLPFEISVFINLDWIEILLNNIVPSFGHRVFNVIEIIFHHIFCPT